MINTNSNLKIKTMRKFYNRALGFLLIFAGFLTNSGSLFAQVSAIPIQMPECTATVPAFSIDLSANPGLTFTTPQIERAKTCCGDGDYYIAFYVTLHPDVASISIEVAPGYADPGGSGNYQIVTGGNLTTPGTCGPEIDAGNPLCITGPGPHKILYSKPGKNDVKYIFRQTTKPIFHLSQPTRVGCTLPLPIYGLNNITVTATSKSANCVASLATCNTYLSCLNCANPIFSPGANNHATLPDYPYSITYSVSGTQQSPTACGTYPASGSFTVTVYDALTVGISPDPAAFCSGGTGILMTANPAGGLPPYTYVWTDSGGSTVSTSSTYNATAAGSYTVTVTDQLITSTCGSESETRTVEVGTLPVVSAGNDTTVCASSPVAILNGSSSTGSGAWSGGAGTFSPNANSLLATYTPTAGEISSGSVTLTLTSTQTDAGCSNSTDQVTIYFSQLINAVPTAGTIACYNGTTVINAGQTQVSGTGPYTYLWSNGTTGTSITATAGTYSLTVTDQYGCSDNTPITITQPSPLGINLTSTLDNGVCDGTATASVSGGTLPYSYSWTPGSLTTATITGLCTGDYTVVVTDNNGCTISQSVVINNDPTCQSLNITIPSHTNVDCYGGSNGTATASVTGGTFPYSYLWTPSGNTTATPSGLSSGTYTVMVTDLNGCKDYASVSILQPTAITNSMTHTDVSSIGGTDGTATANPQGGTPGYTYLWSPGGQTTQTALNLSSGVGGVMYYVDITDSKMCTHEDSVLINQPPCNDFLLSVNTTNVLCNGDSNGSAYIVIANGSGSYSITWSTGATNVTSVTGLTAGTYTVTVTDNASNCTTFQSFSITEPNQLTLGLVPTNISCNGDQNGSIDLTVSGGTYPYSFVWVQGGKIIANHEDLVDMGPGTYTITVTDVNGCTATASIGITQPAALTTTYTYQDNPCHGNSLGSIDATPGGGTTPYTYAWTGTGFYSASTQDISGLPTGGYLLTLTDNNGCVLKTNVNISEPDTLTASAVMTQQVTCAGGTEGDADLTVAGGTTPYTYAWTGPSYTGSSQDLLNVAAGTYNVTVTDAHSCTATASVTITTVLDVTPPVITCPGDQTGNTSSTTCTYTHSGTAWNATATDNCVVSSLTYLLSGATVTTVPASNLNGQVFNKGVTTVTWTATDGLGNSVSCSYTVTISDATAPSIISCGGSTQNINVDAGQCNYTQTGTAWDATASDNCGVVSLTATLTGVTTASGLTTLTGVDFNKGATLVTWTATDPAGLTATCSFTITVIDNINPTILTCGTTQSVNVDVGQCNYTQTGNAWNATASDNCAVVSLTATLSGATTATGLTTLAGVDFNKGATLVTWTATDAAGLTATCTFTITVIDNIDPAILSCGITTSVTVNANSGLCTYTQPTSAWNASATDNCSAVTLSYSLSGVTTGTGTSLAGQTFNLGLTTVTWTATDGSGNTDQCSFTVTVVDVQLPTILSCGAIGDQIRNTDAGQCNYTQTGTGWDATASDNCSVASLTYTLTGATTGTGSSLQNIDFNLGTTVVTWTATDGSGNIRTCSFEVLVTDNQFPAITTCGAGNQTVSADNGVCTFTQTSDAWNAIATDNCTVSTLTYSLAGATTGTGITLNGVTFNLGATVVTWTATDNSNNVTTCTYTITVIDDQDPGIANCPADITVGVDAGDCGAIVSWTPPTITDNCTYSYTVSNDPGDTFPVGTTTVTYTATDGSGNVSVCSFDVTVQDDELPTISCSSNIASCDPLITFAVPVTADNCGVQTVTQTAGLPSGSNFPVGTTTNVYQVTDIHGNTATCSFTVTIHPLPVATTSDVDVTCNGNSDGTINLTVTSGTSPFTYNWDNGGVTEDLAGLDPGTYNVVVTDDNGCTTTASATITEPATLTLTAQDDHVNCYNGTDGAIDITIAGGMVPYTYDWSNGATTQDVTGLTNGAYDVTVTDFNGCTVTYNTVIDEPDTLVIQTSINDATCNAPNGSILTLTTGGTTPYTYSWSDGSNGQNLNNATAGTYTLTVIDGQGCTAMFTGSIAGVSNLTASSIVRDVRCYGQSNGEIQVIMETGNAPYVYDWTNGASAALNDNLAAGSYSVTVTDAFGCEVTMDFDVNQPDSLEVTLTTSAYIAGTNVSVNGASDGWITTDVIGGTPSYTYEWSTGATTPDINNLPAGAYSVVVIDQNGCKASAAVRFSEPLELQMPEGFSPNGDGTNDSFVVHGIEAYPNNDIVIYNRWGNVVYEVSNYQNEWYGDNTAGEPLPDGTYFAILKVYVTDEKTITLKGYVDLRR
jgi:gliding motility-associated-like protein